MRFKITDIDNESFLQIPKSLLTQKNYRGLNSDAKLIYALLKDRMSLSRKNDWKDENGDIFLLFKQEDIADLLGLSISTISRVMKQLQEYKLIEIVRQGLSKPNKIYINKTEPVEEENIQNLDAPFYENTSYEDLDPSPVQIKTCTGANQDLSPMQIKTCMGANLDLSQVQTNNTNINNTERNKTERNNNKQLSPANQIKLEPLGYEKSNVVVEFLKLGITEKQAMWFFERYDPSEVLNQLNNLASQRVVVMNPAGWLRTALEENFTTQNVVEYSDVKRHSGSFYISTTAAEEICAATFEIGAVDDYRNSPFYEFYDRIKAKDGGGKIDQ